MRYSTLFLLFTILLACNNSDTQTKKVLRNGYSYINYTNNAGPRPQVAQIVTIDFDIIDEFGNNLSDSRKANIRPTIQIPPSLNDVTKRNPLLSLVETMTIDDSASVFVPVDSLSSPPAEFLQSKTVEYRVVVRSIEGQELYMSRIGREQQRIQTDALSEAEEAWELYQSGEIDDKIIEKNGGVKLAIIKEAGGVKAEFNELAVVHYYGFFRDGKVFDNSYKLGKPYAFQVGKREVIQGWDIAIPSISEGSTAIIEIPYQMAYGNEGKQGSIPAKSDLIYWVKMERVEKSKKVEN